MYRIVYDKQVAKDIKNLKSVGLDRKAKELIEVVRENPFKNSPPYEGLVGNLKGSFSRRTNIQHRLVYDVQICINASLISYTFQRSVNQLELKVCL